MKMERIYICKLGEKEAVTENINEGNKLLHQGYAVKCIPKSLIEGLVS